MREYHRSADSQYDSLCLLNSLMIKLPLQVILYPIYIILQRVCSFLSSSAQVANRYFIIVVISWYLTAGSLISVCKFDLIRVRKYVAQCMLPKIKERAFSCLVSSYLMFEKLVNTPMKSSIKFFYLQANQCKPSNSFMFFSSSNTDLPILSLILSLIFIERV